MGIEVSEQEALINKLRNQRNIAMRALDRISTAAHAPAKQLRLQAKEAWEMAAIGKEDDEQGR